MLRRRGGRRDYQSHTGFYGSVWHIRHAVRSSYPNAWVERCFISIHDRWGADRIGVPGCVVADVMSANVQTQQETDLADCVVAICRCGRAVYACVVERFESDTRQEIGDLVADGCDIKHIPVVEFRRMPFGCQCQLRQAEIDL